LTLCSVSLQYSCLSANCQTMTSALNPMWVTCPEARYTPEGEQARQEILSECPERKVCCFEATSFTDHLTSQSVGYMLAIRVRYQPTWDAACVYVCVHTRTRMGSVNAEVRVLKSILSLSLHGYLQILWWTRAPRSQLHRLRPPFAFYCKRSLVTMATCAIRMTSYHSSYDYVRSQHTGHV